MTQYMSSRYVLAGSQLRKAAEKHQKKFRLFQAVELRRSSEKIAVRLQREVVNQIQGSYQRPSAVTGFLEKITADPRNIEYTDTGFAVGVLSHLRRKGRPELDYAVVHEVGTHALVGDKMEGFWYAGAFPSGSKYNKRKFKFGTPTSDQKFQSTREFAGIPGYGGVITKPLKAHNDYKHAYKIIRPKESLLREFRRFLSR